VPELPEVETIVRDLQRLVTGASIDHVNVLKPDLIQGDPLEFESLLRGTRIERIGRRAKNIVIPIVREMPGPDLLIINLGMTGRVLVQPETTPEPTHLGVRFVLADGRRILYQDVRRFGSLEVLPHAAWNLREDALGLEPLDQEFTPERLYRLTRASRVSIKPWLMDQRRVVGVGNIYASEALFRAGISPRKAARRLLRREAISLHAAVQAVLQESIDFRGTTLLDYRDADGERGGFAERLRVYDRAGEPCRRCGTRIRRIVQGGRSTFFCPTCQR
jgi:formamidopyrimidine-DNA glycosylase